MHFTKVVWNWKKLSKPLQYGWLLKISTQEELETYERRLDTSVQQAFVDFRRVSERRMAGQGYHFADGLARNVDALAQISGPSWVGELSKVHAAKLSGMAGSLPVYVNRVGGYMPARPGLVELEALEADRWPTLVEEKPRFLQWPGGTHWYCKVGGVDIEVDGRQKWDTQAEVERAYAKWLRQRLMKV